jgi:AcrR family transcriptional regulator
MRRRSATPPTARGGKAATVEPTIREHILDRTIYLMGKQGTTDVPVRAIAREAGVNVAAVNY